MEIFLDDQTSEHEDSKNQKMLVLLKNWRPKLEVFEEKFLDLKSHLPHLG
jgi:hypothetical protein